MSSLRINLMAGFDAEPVVLRLDGREVYSQPAVRTDYSIGLADSLAVEVDGNVRELEVALPRRGVRQVIPLSAVGGHGGVQINVSPSGEVTAGALDADSPLL
jgi:hypothetical protein